MILPLSWLRQFVPVPETIEQVARRFLQLGFEAEIIEDDRLDLEVTPNRGDALSILGLAREYAAVTDQELILPPRFELTQSNQLADWKLDAPTALFNRIAACRVDNLRIGPSPEWLRQALESVGFNSINNIVDLTNYVMIELGIPLHAFDLDQLEQSPFQLRLSRAGESFLSLKDELKVLTEGLLVVESAGQLIDLVGIRGGRNGMVTAQTSRILIWALSLPRPLIRKAIKATQLSTESSYRLERETDPAMVPVALARIGYLVTKLGGQTGPMVDYSASQTEPPVIDFDPDKVNRLLGTSWSAAVMEKVLSRLGFKLRNGQVTVPSWRRFDVTGWEDLAEEIARVIGYEDIPTQLITAGSPQPVTLYEQQESLKDELVAAGFTEVYCESMTGPIEPADLGAVERSLAELANPVNPGLRYCRPALKFQLCSVLAHNAWADDAAIFEIGNVFPSSSLELTNLGVAYYGSDTSRLKKWFKPDEILVIKPSDQLSQRYKLRRPIVLAEGSVTERLKDLERRQLTIAKDRPDYKLVSAFPPSVRDISILVDRALDPALIGEALAAIDPAHIILVELFDQFSSDRLGPDKQSLAYHIVYQDRYQTMSSQEVDKLNQKVIKSLITDFKATIR